MHVTKLVIACWLVVVCLVSLLLLKKSQEPFEEDDEEFYMFCEAGLFEECYRYWLDYEGRSIKKFVPCKSWNDFDEANENGHRIDDFEEV